MTGLEGYPQDPMTFFFIGMGYSKYWEPFHGRGLLKTKLWITSYVMKCPDKKPFGV